MPGDPAGVELFKPAFQTTCLIWRKRHRRWQMSSLSAQPLDAPWRCPFLGVDRKWPERPDSVAFDPHRTTSVIATEPGSLSLGLRLTR